MNSENLKSKVLDRLKKEEVKVKPKWQFTLKNAAYWTFLVLATLLGSVAMSLVIFKLLNNDWDVYELAGRSLPNFVLLTLPYFWIIIFVLLSALSYFNFRHTKGGYKQPVAIIILSSLLISMVVGFGIYLFNGPQYLDQQAINRFEFYRDIEFQPREEIWGNPENGLIAGEVIETDLLEENTILIEDFESNTWTIETDDINPKPTKTAVAGDQLAITGEMVEEGVFRAETIRPWKGSFFKKPVPNGQNASPINKNFQSPQSVDQIKKFQIQKKLKENES